MIYLHIILIVNLPVKFNFIQSEYFIMQRLRNLSQTLGKK